MADVSALTAVLVGLPFLAAALLRVPSLTDNRFGPSVVALPASVACTVVAGVLTSAAADGPVVQHVGGWLPVDGLALAIPLVADQLVAGFLFLVGLLISAALLHIAVTGARGGGLTQVLTLLLLGALSGFLLAGDLFTTFVFLELTGISVYALTAGKSDEPAALPAAVNLAVVSTAGAVLLLAGVGLFYSALGTPNLASASLAVGEGPVGPRVAVAVALVAVGFAAKAGLVPFHFVHADVDSVTTIQHAGLFGALVLPAALYGLVRLLSVPVGGTQLAGDRASALLVAVAAGTAVLGAVMALAQDHLQRLLAFSSISHLGVAAVGLAMLTPEGTAAASMYVLGHAPVKVGLLLVVAGLLHRFGTQKLPGLAGRAREAPVATGLLLVGGLALAGAPPSGLFAGKTEMGKAASELGLTGVVPLLYLASVLTGAAVVRVVVHLVTGWAVPVDRIGVVAEQPRDPADRPRPLLLVIPAALLLAGLAVPLVPQVGDALPGVGAQFHDRAGYAAAVLGGERRPAPAGEPMEFWAAEGLVHGGLATAATLGLGVAVARWRGRRSWGVWGAPVRWLRLAHRGHVGDYTAWLTVGVAAWCGWAVLAVG